MQSETVLDRLRSLADGEYAAFQLGLIPGVAPERVLGVRTPALRKLARELRGTAEAEQFMAELPHGYYDENNLHGLLINEMRSYDAALTALEAFLPHVDNWATCDILSPRAFKTRPEGLMDEVRAWLSSGRTYTVRFGLGVLLGFYLDEGFDAGQLELAAGCCCGEYYIDMMVAWYFATAAAKQPESALPYIYERRLSRWVHNKTIQKCVESRRISPELKERLKTLRWK